MSQRGRCFLGHFVPLGTDPQIRTKGEKKWI